MKVWTWGSEAPCSTGEDCAEEEDKAHMHTGNCGISCSTGSGASMLWEALALVLQQHFRRKVSLHTMMCAGRGWSKEPCQRSRAPANLTCSPRAQGASVPTGPVPPPPPPLQFPCPQPYTFPSPQVSCSPPQPKCPFLPTSDLSLTDL